jgi:hypothetical protein
VTDLPHPADAALGAGWQPPGQRRLEHAWRDHERRDELDELAAERDDDGMPRWETVRLLDPSDDFVEHWLRTVDPFDERPPIRIAVWPLKVETAEIRDATAVISEHEIDP